MTRDREIEREIYNKRKKEDKEKERRQRAVPLKYDCK